MNIIKPKANIDFEYVPIYKKLERIGRVCYKSEDKITSESHIKFLKAIINRGHTSVLEHHLFVLEVSSDLYSNIKRIVSDVSFHHINYTNTLYDGNRKYLISISARGLRDLFSLSPCVFIGTFVKYLVDRFPVLFDDLNIYNLREDIHFSKTTCFIESLLTNSDIDNLNPKDFEVHKLVTVRFDCDRGISHELVRHRKFSFSQASTRYCNYKGGVTFIEPFFYPKGLKRLLWLVSCKVSEISYKFLVKKSRGGSPQNARTVLNNSLATEVIMSGTPKWWGHFFRLRCANDSHPQMLELTNDLYQEFKKKEYL